MERDERSIFDLTPGEQDVLKAIHTVDDLSDVRFIRTWIQENLPCVALSVNGIEMSLHDLDTEEAASLMNPQGADAKRILLKQIRSRARLINSEELDDEDEFEPQEVESDSSGSGYSEDYGNY